LVEAHLAGDAEATAVWLRSVYHWQRKSCPSSMAIDPEVIILGGGIAHKREPLSSDPLNVFLEKMEWRHKGTACTSFRRLSAILRARSALLITRCIGVN